MCKKGSRYNRNIIAIDLFCGIGGLTYGLRRAGISVVAGLDVDETCRYPYERNNNTVFIYSDIKSSDLSRFYPKNCIKVLTGCAPCQPFSKHTQKNKDRKKTEEWGLLNSFSRIIRELGPDIVSMENVPQIVKYEVFNDFINVLKNIGYFVFWKIVYCPTYGVPQNRKRLVLLASKFGEIFLIPETHKSHRYKTVRSAIGKLPKIEAGDVDARDPLHRALSLSPLNLQRIKQSKPDGSWLDWDEELIAHCHKRSSGKTYGSVYARMSWDKPAPTITTQFYSFGTGRFGHPEQDRALSLREGALLQTFPRHYVFWKPNLPFSFKRIGTHIGNAVPVRLGVVIGKSIIRHVEGCYE